MSMVFPAPTPPCMYSPRMVPLALVDDDVDVAALCVAGVHRPLVNTPAAPHSQIRAERVSYTVYVPSTSEGRPDVGKIGSVLLRNAPAPAPIGLDTSACLIGRCG